MTGSSLRLQTARLAVRWMTENMGWSQNVVDPVAARFAASSTRIVEVAHTPHLFHLGTARLLIEAEREANFHDGVVLFCVNDHLPVASLPECRFLPLIGDKGTIAKPPRFGPGKRGNKNGMAWCPPPSLEKLDVMAERWRQLRLRHMHRFENQMRLLRRASSETNSLAAWLVRVCLENLQICPIVLPTTLLNQIVRSANMKFDDSVLALGWQYCPICGYRMERWHGVEVDQCPYCQSTHSGNFFIPDVVGRQIIANKIGITTRLSGRYKSYHIDSDERSKSCDIAPPPRKLIDGESVWMPAWTDEPLRRANLFQVIAESKRISSPPRDIVATWIVSD